VVSKTRDWYFSNIRDHCGFAPKVITHAERVLGRRGATTFHDRAITTLNCGYENGKGKGQWRLPCSR